MFLAGDDVPKKKPDPTIYRIAAERLGVSPEQCVVIEDSTIGAQARPSALHLPSPSHLGLSTCASVRIWIACRFPGLVCGFFDNLLKRRSLSHWGVTPH